MFTGFQASDRLRSMHLRRCRQYDRIYLIEGQHVGEIIGPMFDAILTRNALLRAARTVNDRGHLGSVDHLNGGEVLAAECTCTGKSQLHHVS